MIVTLYGDEVIIKDGSNVENLKFNSQYHTVSNFSDEFIILDEDGKPFIRVKSNDICVVDKR